MPKIGLIKIPEGYRSQSEDTCKEMDFLRCSILREMSVIKKSELTIGITKGCRHLTLSGIRNKHSNLTKKEQKEIYKNIILGEDLSKSCIGEKTDNQEDIMIGNPIELALLIGEILDSLEIIYFVGGSVASSLWGEPRTTLDLDIVADLKLKDIDNFIAKVEPLFYVSETAVKEGIMNESCFNLIHFNTSEKIDIFIPNQNPLIQEEIKRRRLEKVTEKNDYLYIATAEDMILQKLIWYRQGEEISERQWRDILGILKVQSRELDFSYLKFWVEKEKLIELFKKALRESGLSEYLP